MTLKAEGGGKVLRGAQHRWNNFRVHVHAQSGYTDRDSEPQYSRLSDTEESIIFRPWGFEESEFINLRRHHFRVREANLEIYSEVWLAMENKEVYKV